MSASAAIGIVGFINWVVWLKRERPSDRLIYTPPVLGYHLLVMLMIYVAAGLA